MFARLFYILITILALPAWLLGLVLPLAWLAVAVAGYLLHGSANPSLTCAWHLRLHASSLVLMVLATIVALSLATAAAASFARLGRLAIAWVAVGVLVVPPLVYGYLWFVTLGSWITLQSLPVPFNLPAPSLPNLLLAAWAMGLWLWPIAAVVLTVGWQWIGRPAWLLARMDATDSRAFLRAALPAMQPCLLGAAAICLLLAAQDYAVPALFSVQTWQTQWLELARAGVPLGQLVLAALPPALFLLVLIAMVVRLRRSVESLGPADLGAVLLQRRSRFFAWATLLTILLLTAVVPAIGAVLSLPKNMSLNLLRFQDALLDTPIIMAAAATLALVAAFLALPRLSRRRIDVTNPMPGSVRVANTRNDAPARPGLFSPLYRLTPGKSILVLAVVSWTLPISLLAEAVKQAQTAFMAILDRLGQQIPPVNHLLNQPDLLRWLDLLMWISILAGRMLPIAAILLALVSRSLPAHMAEQAAIEGAGRSQIFHRILLPLLAPAAGAAWIICALLVATDTAAATFLRPPGFEVLSVSLLNQMHYGRDADVISMCLLLLAAAAIGAAIVAGTLGRTASNDTLS